MCKQFGGTEAAGDKCGGSCCFYDNLLRNILIIFIVTALINATGYTACCFYIMLSNKHSCRNIYKLITDKFPLEEINEALKTNLAMTGLKIAIVNK